MNTNLIPYYVTAAFAAGAAYAIYLYNAKVKFTTLKPKFAPVVAISDGHDDDTPSKNAA